MRIPRRKRGKIALLSQIYGQAAVGNHKETSSAGTLFCLWGSDSQLQPDCLDPFSSLGQSNGFVDHLCSRRARLSENIDDREVRGHTVQRFVDFAARDLASCRIDGVGRVSAILHPVKNSVGSSASICRGTNNCHSILDQSQGLCYLAFLCLPKCRSFLQECLNSFFRGEEAHTFNHVLGSQVVGCVQRCIALVQEELLPMHNHLPGSFRNGVANSQGLLEESLVGGGDTAREAGC
mmetsp:Transcript_63042/g.133060  ORF Transcript_63042/g.133060 Transcript_63042/m.133060 type:complete len:236 (+) Transcript_63042:431-1138(+)